MIKFLGFFENILSRYGILDNRKNHDDYRRRHRHHYCDVDPVVGVVVVAAAAVVVYNGCGEYDPDCWFLPHMICKTITYEDRLGSFAVWLDRTVHW